MKFTNSFPAGSSSSRFLDCSRISRILSLRSHISILPDCRIPAEIPKSNNLLSGKDFLQSSCHWPDPDSQNRRPNSRRDPTLGCCLSSELQIARMEKESVNLGKICWLPAIKILGNVNFHKFLSSSQQLLLDSQIAAGYPESNNPLRLPQITILPDCQIPAEIPKSNNLLSGNCCLQSSCRCPDPESQTRRPESRRDPILGCCLDSKFRLPEWRRNNLLHGNGFLQSSQFPDGYIRQRAHNLNESIGGAQNLRIQLQINKACFKEFGLQQSLDPCIWLLAGVQLS